MATKPITRIHDFLNGLVGTVLTFKEQTTPSTPASGRVAVFGHTDGKVHVKDDTGLESVLGPAIPKVLGVDVSIDQTTPHKNPVWMETFVADSPTMYFQFNISAINVGMANVLHTVIVGKRNAAARLSKVVVPFTAETGATEVTFYECGTDSGFFEGNYTATTQVHRVNNLTVGATYNIELWISIVGGSARAIPAPSALLPTRLDLTPDSNFALQTSYNGNYLATYVIGNQPYWSAYKSHGEMRALSEFVFKTGFGAYAVAVDPRLTSGEMNSGLVVITGWDSKQICVFDLVKNMVSAYYTWPGTGNPMSVAWRPGTAVCYIGDTNGAIYPFDTAARTFGGLINIGASKWLWNMDISTDGTLLWVADYTASRAVPVTIPAGTIGTATTLAGQPLDIRCAPDKSAWTANSSGTKGFQHVAQAGGSIADFVISGITTPTSVDISSDGLTIYGLSTTGQYSYFSAVNGQIVEVGAAPGVTASHFVRLTDTSYVLFTTQDGVFQNPGSQWYCRPVGGILSQEHAQLLLWGGH